MEVFSCLKKQLDLISRGGIPDFSDNEQYPKIPSEAIYNFAVALWHKDKYTYCHSCRVARFSLRLAHELNASDAQCDFIYTCAFLHDIGKLKISDTILKKNTVLTKEEWLEVQNHSQYGQAMAENIPYLKAAGKIIRHHHEKINGSGYPDRLKGNEIPYESRIIAVADSYDAMRSRVYSTKKASLESLEEIKNNIGSQFDAEIASSFVDIRNNREDGIE